MTHFTIDDKLFKSDIHVFVCLASEYQEFARNEWGDEDRQAPADDASAMFLYYTLTHGRERYVLWFDSIPTLGQIVHETHHATLHILEFQGVPVLNRRFHLAIDEVSARYQEWLAEEVVAGIAKESQWSLYTFPAPTR